MKVLDRKFVLAALVLVGLVIATAGAASAQTDVYKVNYFSNNNPQSLPPTVAIIFTGPWGTVRITNPGLTYGNLCAMIYVFDQDQQLSECCGCSVSHNGLLTLSIRNDLTPNPLTGGGNLVHVSNNGAIKVVSAAINDTPCDPTSNVTPKANLRVWVTHIQNLPPLNYLYNYGVTETESSDSTLGTAELAALQAQCAYANILGSGAGVCTCGTGD
jgi:hypothetical protein